MKSRRVYLVLAIISIFALGYALIEEALSPQPVEDRIFVAFLGISANIIQIVAFVREELSQNRLSELIEELAKRARKQEIAKMTPGQLMEHILAEYEKSKEKTEKDRSFN